MELTIFNQDILRLIDENEALEKLSTGYTFVEGPVFVKGIHYFTDFMVNKIYKYEKDSGKITLFDDNSHYSIGMTYDRRKDRILRCTRDLRSITDMDGNIIVHEYNGVPINGSNDIIVDSKGRIFFTDPLTRKIEGPQVGHSSVFMFDEEKSELTLLEKTKTLPFPNGLALSPNETTLYIIDTKHLSIYAMDLATGNMELFIKMDQGKGEGGPDGMRLDIEGNIYSTGPGGIWIINPAGEALGIIKMPEFAANLCFDDTGIFITASTSIYHVKTKIPGIGL
jgi:gluconolactonase